MWSLVFPDLTSTKKWQKREVQRATPYEHLAEVDEDGRLEDGVGREVLKLKPELLQQQQEEG
jgi:hypothetical protein